MDSSLGSAPGLRDLLISQACGNDAFIARQYGLTLWELALGKAFLYGVVFLFAFSLWQQQEKKFYANGFAKPVFQGGLWILVLFTLYQILHAFSSPLGQLLPCPQHIEIAALVLALVFLGLACFHLGYRYAHPTKRGDFSKFGALLIGPILGDTALSWNDIGGSWSRMVLSFYSFVTHHGPL